MKKLLICFSVLLILILSACSNSMIEKNIRTEINHINSITVPESSLSLEETIQKYFELQYEMYIDMKYTDLRYFLDIDKLNNKNYVHWLRNLFTRREVIEENQDIYVEKEIKPFYIIFNQEPEDDRMTFYEEREIIIDYDEIIHFTIASDNDIGYPPFFALNDQHTMALNHEKGRWKIIFHYFPGSSRHRADTLRNITSREKMEKLIELELVNNFESDEIVIYDQGIPYSNDKAVYYANKYISNHNDRFYLIDDWMGNCANFTSQAIWYGFAKSEDVNIRDYMTSQWYAGHGGGSPAWENVSYFWRFITKDSMGNQQGIYGQTVDNINLLEKGGLIQIKSKASPDNGSFSHNLILVDKDKMILAQNSPDCLIYYSDLVNVDFRFFNPKMLIVEE